MLTNFDREADFCVLLANPSQACRKSPTLIICAGHLSFWNYFCNGRWSPDSVANAIKSLL